MARSKRQRIVASKGESTYDLMVPGRRYAYGKGTERYWEAKSTGAAGKSRFRRMQTLGGRQFDRGLQLSPYRSYTSSGGTMGGAIQGMQSNRDAAARAIRQTLRGTPPRNPGGPGEAYGVGRAQMHLAIMAGRGIMHEPGRGSPRTKARSRAATPLLSSKAAGINSVGGKVSFTGPAAGKGRTRTARRAQYLSGLLQGRVAPASLTKPAAVKKLVRPAAWKAGYLRGAGQRPMGKFWIKLSSGRFAGSMPGAAKGSSRR